MLSVVKTLRKIQKLAALEKLSEDGIIASFMKGKITSTEYEFLLNNIYLINNLIHNTIQGNEEKNSKEN